MQTSGRAAAGKLHFRVGYEEKYITALGHENKEYLRSHDVDGQGEFEAVKHGIWGVLFSWPWPVYYFSASPARESQLWHFLAVVQK